MSVQVKLSKQYSYVFNKVFSKTFYINTNQKSYFLDHETLYRIVRGSDIPDYATDCNSIPSHAKYLKLVMGSVVDYFKPVAGKSYCEMLQSYKLHQWSPDGLNWETPSYHSNHFGGSKKNFPKHNITNDERSHLSFWGINLKGHTGGCCHYSYTDSPSWEREFALYYNAGIIYISIRTLTLNAV